MHERVAGGMTWMVVAVTATKITTFVAQAILGWYLLPEHFALYATATTISGFMMICRDMGVREILIQTGRARYAELSGPCFWLAFAYNMGMAILMAAVAYPLAVYVFHDIELARMLWVMCVALPIGTLTSILQAKLRLEMRFAAFGGQIIVSSVIRQVSMVLLAVWGYGPMALAIPVVVAAVSESVGTYVVSRDWPWMRAPRFELWRGLVSRAKWFMLGSVAVVSLDFGPYLVLSPALGASHPQVGIYFFAFQLTAQIGVLLSFNSLQVLLPALVAMQHEPERMRQASLRALRSLMLVGSIASLGLASIIAPLEDLIWRGRWAESVEAVIIMGFFFPWRVTSGLCSSLLMAQNRTKAYAVLTMLEGVGLVVVTGLAVSLQPSQEAFAWWSNLAAACAGTPFAAFFDGVARWVAPSAGTSSWWIGASGLSIWTGLWLLVSRLTVTYLVFRPTGAPTKDVMMAVFPSWLLAILAGAAGFAADEFSGIGPIVARLVGGNNPSSAIAVTAANLARILVAGGACSLCFALFTRLLIPEQLRETISALPARVRPLVNMVLRLKP